MPDGHIPHEPDARQVLATLSRSFLSGLAPAEARRFHDENLARIVAYASGRSPFYRDRLAPVMGRSGPRLQNWSRIPLLTKDELRQNREAIVLTSLPPEAGKPRSGWTSGSEGDPLNYVSTALADTLSIRATQRFMGWWKVDGRGRFAQVIADRFAATAEPQPRVTRGWYAGVAGGELHACPVTVDLRRQLEWLQQLRPAYLKSYPEVLRAFAEMSLRQARQLPMQLLFSGGGVLTDEVRQLSRAAFGCEIADFYGAEEVGPIAAQCPDCSDYHVVSENLHLEILRSDGSEARPGEEGQVVVTCFFNHAMPLIRYALGDVVVAGRSTCARGSRTLRRVLGRSRAIFTLPDGQRVWPYIPSAEMGRVANVRRYQFVQEARDRIAFRYVPSDPGAAVDSALLQRLVDDFIGSGLAVTPVPVESIEREQHHKYMLYRRAPGLL